VRSSIGCPYQEGIRMMALLNVPIILSPKKENTFPQNNLGRKFSTLGGVFPPV